MPDIPGTSRAQTLFLRAFHTNSTGPAPDQWPNPSILRRWLRKPAFRRALLSLLQTLRFQADFTLAAAASSASQSLAGPADADNIARLSSLLRLSHQRQHAAGKSRRAAADDELAGIDDFDSIEDTDRALELAEKAIQFLRPDDRLTDDEFHELATSCQYIPGISNYDVFPPPPPKGSVYHDILAHPKTLLAFLKRVNDTDPHKRYSYILERCKDRVCADQFIPKMSPA